ncbi:hypothetical protein Dimus_021373 [Dionaea muscipula]
MISYKGLDSELKITRSLGSGKMVLQGSISFKQSDILETKVSIKVSSPRSDCMIMGKHEQSPRSDCRMISWNSTTSPSKDDGGGDDAGNPKHLAATKLQKVYKSFRTRRKLADCAVLVEQSWWKLLDFAELKQNSISFFDHENQESAVSRWSRAKSKAAKVGKGLSKCAKARKLALQHWLEAIDPRHRYGHNLHFYYDKWLESQSRQPFFYWLDIGEGKEVNLSDKCPRSKLQQQCIKYLGPMERKACEVLIKNGKLFFQQSGEIVDTTLDLHSKWIFVLSTSETLYVGKKKKGTFQHSSFLAGGASSAAGRLVVEKGNLKAVWPHSGHYKPTTENFQDFLAYLTSHNVDLAGVEMNHVDDEEDQQSLKRQKSSCFSSSNLAEDESSEEAKSRRGSLNLVGNLPNLEIPKRDDYYSLFNSEDNGKVAAADQQGEKKEENIVSEERILQRINSHKESNSYQLGKQLSSKWTTGAGPRIGCLRDYPSELQLHALELVDLSPRPSNGFQATYYTPRFPNVTSNLGASAPTKIIRHKSTPRCGLHLQCSPVSKQSKPMKLS